MQARKYQSDAVNTALYLMEAEAKRHIVLSASVSWGKSLFLSELANQLTGKVLIIVNITALIDQIAEHLDEIGADYSILKAGYEDRFDPSKKIQLVMSQTYYARHETIDFGEVNFVLQDECHKEWMTDRTNLILRKINPVSRCGVSGSPYDESGYALEGVDEVIETITVKELEANGFTAPLKYYVPKWSEQIDYDEMRSSGSDYSGVAIDELLNNPKHISMVVDSMNKMDGKNKKTLVFANSIEHADAITAALVADGYKAYSYHSESDGNSDIMMEAFKYGSIRNADANLFGDDEFVECKCLVSVSKIAVGFSVQDIEMGVMCRPTKVLSLWRQQLGRIQRAHESKTHGIILDLCGGISRHGFHDEPYHPPKRGDKRALIKAQERLQSDVVHQIVAEEPTEVNRKMIVDKIEEILTRSRSIPLLKITELIAMYETSTSIETLIHIGFEMNKRKTGQDYTEQTVKWCAAPWLEAFEAAEDDPVHYNRKHRFTKAARTRIKNIVSEGKKLSAIHYFCQFLLDHEDDPYTGGNR